MLLSQLTLYINSRRSFIAFFSVFAGQIVKFETHGYTRCDRSHGRSTGRNNVYNDRTTMVRVEQRAASYGARNIAFSNGMDTQVYDEAATHSKKDSVEGINDTNLARQLNDNYVNEALGMESNDDVWDGKEMVNERNTKMTSVLNSEMLQMKELVRKLKQLSIDLERLTKLGTKKRLYFYTGLILMSRNYVLSMIKETKYRIVLLQETHEHIREYETQSMKPFKHPLYEKDGYYSKLIINEYKSVTKDAAKFEQKISSKISSIYQIFNEFRVVYQI